MSSTPLNFVDETKELINIYEKDDVGVTFPTESRSPASVLEVQSPASLLKPATAEVSETTPQPQESSTWSATSFFQASGPDERKLPPLRPGSFGSMSLAGIGSPSESFLLLVPSLSHLRPSLQIPTKPSKMG